MSATDLKPGGLVARSILFLVAGDWSNEVRMFHASREEYDILSRKCDVRIGNHHLPGADITRPDAEYRFIEQFKVNHTDVYLVKVLNVPEQHASSARPSRASDTRELRKSLLAAALIAGGAAFLSAKTTPPANAPRRTPFPEPRQICPGCGGRGKVPSDCSLCGGRGRPTFYIGKTPPPCVRCGGSGRHDEACRTCGGRGYIR